jgi:hypothetical protein
MHYSKEDCNPIPQITKIHTLSAHGAKMEFEHSWQLRKDVRTGHQGLF